MHVLRVNRHAKPPKMGSKGVRHDHGRAKEVETNLTQTIQGQRRQVSVLFADMVGFTSIAERIGEEASFRLIQVVTARMMEAVHAQGGSVQEFRGDGIMALFGAPVALEDAPLRACRAALDIQRAIRDLGDDLERDHGARPQARIGIHAGQLVVGEVGDDQRMRFTAIGDTVNLAARLETEADSGTIFISDTLHEMVSGQVDATDLGPREVKGKSQPQHMLRLDGLREGVTRFDAARSRGLTRLLERDPELDRLHKALAATDSGDKQVVHLVGEAGIGKSRLMYEFQQSLSETETRFLQGDCRADGATTPFLPFVELVRTAFNVKKRDDRVIIEGKLRDGLEHIGFDVATSLPYLMVLLGQDDDADTMHDVSADVVGLRLRQLLLDLLWHSCRERRVVLFIEDLHWIDPGSEDLLNRIVQSDTSANLLLVFAYRPYYTPPWTGHTDITRIPLDPLTKDGMVHLLTDRLGGGDLGRELVRLVIEKAEGNPLYAEEIAKFLQERRSQPGDQPDSDTTLVLPANLQNLVMDRFDRLSRDTRTILEAASVAGRRFNSTMLRDLLGLEAPLDILMSEAERQELILPIQDRDSDYIFKHALVQDAIYDTLMAARRRQLHADIGETLEDLNTGRTDEVADVLAYHFQNSDLHDKAVRYLAAAGRKSLNIFSLKVADTRFARAVDLIDQHKLKVDDDLHSAILKNWLETRQWTADFGRTFKIFQPRLEAIRKLKNAQYYPHILGLLGTAYVQLLKFDDAEAFLDEAMQLGEARRDIEAIGPACIGLMGLNCVRWRKNSAAEVQRYADLLLSTDLANNLYYRTYCRFFVTWSKAIRGDFDISLAEGHETAAMGRRENYPGAIGFGLTAVAYNETFLENYDAAIAMADEGSRLSGGVVDKAICDGIKGLATALSGDGQGGLDQLQRIYDELTELEYYSMYNIVDMPIGVAMATLGDLSGGAKWIERAAEDNLAKGNTHGAGMAYNALGELYLQIATGKEKPPLDVLRRNAGFLLRTLPVAKKKAIACFDKAAEIGRTYDMYGVTAMACLNKGKAQIARRKPKEALSALDEAQDALAHVSWSAMTEKVNATRNMV